MHTGCTHRVTLINRHDAEAILYSENNVGAIGARKCNFPPFQETMTDRKTNQQMRMGELLTISNCWLPHFNHALVKWDAEHLYNRHHLPSLRWSHQEIIETWNTWSMILHRHIYFLTPMCLENWIFSFGEKSAVWHKRSLWRRTLLLFSAGTNTDKRGRFIIRNGRAATRVRCVGLTWLLARETVSFKC